MADNVAVNVVLKYYDTTELPRLEATLPLDEKGAALWASAIESFGGAMTIGRLFRDVLGEKLDALKRIASRRADGEHGEREHGEGETGAEPRYSLPAFENYLWVSLVAEDGDEREARSFAAKLAHAYLQLEAIEYAYIRLADVPASPPPAPLRSPSLQRRSRTLYSHLQPSPNGIGASAVASEQAGATGKGQTVVDIEWGWYVDHPALLNARGQTRISTASTPTVAPKNTWSHGTRTLGILCGGNAVGSALGRAAPGIATEVLRVEVVSTWNGVQGGTPTAAVLVKAAADRLEAALPLLEDRNHPSTARNRTDTFVLNQNTVILIELTAQLPERDYHFPVEIYPDTLAAIKLLTDADIVVIEAAGNAPEAPEAPEAPVAPEPSSDSIPFNRSNSVDLDILVSGRFLLARDGSTGYDLRDRPENKPNPIRSLNRAFAENGKRPERDEHGELAPFVDSGAIMVAAGDPHTSPRKKTAHWTRWDDSNYGSRIDCFAQGVSVATLEYDETHSDVLYTAFFDGTSAASAIIAGAALCVQGAALAELGAPLSATALRAALRDVDCGTKSGTPDQDKIGSMPDLLQVVKKHLR